MIFAVDPGNVLSAYVILDDDLKPKFFGKIENDKLLNIIAKCFPCKSFVIEMIASYGMSVGKTTFETCVWIGRFWEAALRAGFTSLSSIKRMEEKMNLCHTMKAKDTNIRQALIDRFGVVGTKKNPGWFYGVSKDVWSAIAVGVTYADKIAAEKHSIPGGETVVRIEEVRVDKG